MSKERELTKKELARKEKFEALCAQMEQSGYSVKTLTVGIVQANILAVVIMLPFMALFAWLYYAANRGGVVSFSPWHALLFICVLLVLTVLHELLHGLTWGLFAKSHFKSIDFGIIWSMLTPYCTCSEPMKKWQYLLGCAMPTLILGFALGAISAAVGSIFLFCVSELMIIGGGGDFLIILKVLLYRTKTEDAVYLDHPYECGLVVFEK
jgi:hypothetical protein